MQRLNVVVAQRDATSATRMALALRKQCGTVYVADTPEQVRDAVPKQRADVAIVDLELVGLGEVERLHQQFGNLAIVTTHRVADEEMWTQSLEAGAMDCCCPQDVLAALATPALELRTHSHRAA